MPYKAFIFGTGSWGIGLIFKMIVNQIFMKRIKSQLMVSLTNGFFSGFFELSASFILILLVKDKISFDLNSIISFGLAIGSFECLLVAFSKGNDLLKGTFLEEESKKLCNYLSQLIGLKYYSYNVMLPAIERIIATIIHVSTRGFLFISLFSGNYIFLAIALLVFIIADGLLGSYYYVSGKFLRKNGYILFYLEFSILASVSLTLFIIYIAPWSDSVL